MANIDLQTRLGGCSQLVTMMQAVSDPQIGVSSDGQVQRGGAHCLDVGCLWMVCLSYAYRPSSSWVSRRSLA